MPKKLGRNDPCWCNSGRKYKHCHLNRGSEPKLPLEAIIAKTADSAHYQTCLHPEAAPNVCAKIAFAHTLQRSRVLRSIESADHHVLTFYPMRLEGGEIKVHRRGWRKASTFDAFCTKHDSITFAPLENEPFSGSKEQIFLIAYRAVCWELYQKQQAIRGLPTLRKLIDRGAPVQSQQLVQHFFEVQNSGFNKGYEDVRESKFKMDAAYLQQDYRDFESLRIKVKGALEIAATGAITPNRSLSGAKLQALHDSAATIERLPFGVDVEPDGFSIVFLWEKKAEAPKKYIGELESLGDKELECFLPQFFFAHCENTYFSESWWQRCSEEDQAFIKSLAMNWNPYYYPPEYALSRRLAPWTIVCKERAE